MYYVLLDVNLDSKNTALGFAATKGLIYLDVYWQKYYDFI